MPTADERAARQKAIRTQARALSRARLELEQDDLIEHAERIRTIHTGAQALADLWRGVPVEGINLPYTQSLVDKTNKLIGDAEGAAGATTQRLDEIRRKLAELDTLDQNAAAESDDQ